MSVASVLFLSLVGITSLHPDSACGKVLTADTILEADLEACPWDGLAVGADGITLDCAGHSIRGSSALGSAGVRISDHSRITIRGCSISGFSTGVWTSKASHVVVSDNRLADNAQGVRADETPELAITGNRLERQWSQIRVRRSRNTHIAENAFTPDAEGRSSIYLIESPDSVVFRNTSHGGGSIELYEGSDRSRVAENTFRGEAHIALFLGSGYRILANSFLSDGRAESGGSIMLLGTTDSFVTGNRIEGQAVGSISLFAQQVGDRVRGADRNRVEENDLVGSLYGVQIMGSSANHIRGNRLDSRRVGVLVYPYTEAIPPVAAKDNVLESNVIRAGHFGTYSVNTTANEFRGNDVRTEGVGMFDLRTEPVEGVSNVYAKNALFSNAVFGLVAWGSSPRIVANRFQDNGGGGTAAGDLDPLPLLLGGLRGGLAFLPFDGFDPADWDDGDPSNDLGSAPTIGGTYQKNVFRDNRDVDVYALDARAQNGATLSSDNRFNGTEPRVRQDWFGLVRVEDEDGLPVTGAKLAIEDALGDLVGNYTAGNLGFVPADPDPSRPHGQAPRTGSLGPWARFTEYVVDAQGRRQAATPHWLVAKAPGERGRARYSWDGLDNDANSYHIVRGRYQIARVRLGTGCGSLADLRGAIAEASIARGSVLRSLLDRVDEAARSDAQRGPARAADALCGLIMDLNAQAGHHVLATVAGDLTYCTRETADALAIPLVCRTIAPPSSARTTR